VAGRSHPLVSLFSLPLPPLTSLDSQGSPLRDCVSTNTKGRQRPPSREAYTAELAEDYNQSRPAMTVSIKDFNNWLSQNKKWSQYKKDKVCDMTVLSSSLSLSLCLSRLSALFYQISKMDEKHQEDLSATIRQPQ
jgi:hypothetical protein